MNTVQEAMEQRSLYRSWHCPWLEVEEIHTIAAVRQTGIMHSHTVHRHSFSSCSNSMFLLVSYDWLICPDVCRFWNGRSGWAEWCRGENYKQQEQDQQQCGKSSNWLMPVAEFWVFPWFLLSSLFASFSKCIGWEGGEDRGHRESRKDKIWPLHPLLSTQYLS